MMKKLKKVPITFLASLYTLFLIGFGNSDEASAQNVGINGTGNSPHTSAILDVESTTKGLLPPRMTTVQRDAIVIPASGLVIYNTTTNCVNFYTNLGWYEDCGAPVCGSADITIIHNSFTYKTVQSATGKCWLDRNIGATQVATGSNTAASYGYFYQWGRSTDGHQTRTPLSANSATNATSATDNPGNSNFIRVDAVNNNDWRIGGNNSLWQGVSGINNPCPSGYRLPTETEIYAERLIFSTFDAAGAFSSVLKLTTGGVRFNPNGTIANLGNRGLYWTSTVSGNKARFLGFSGTFATMTSFDRAFGMSVRCIKD